jgi:hypothetical protein
VIAERQACFEVKAGSGNKSLDVLLEDFIALKTQLNPGKTDYNYQDN